MHGSPQYSETWAEGRVNPDERVELDTRFWFLLFSGWICLTSPAWPNQAIGVVLTGSFLYVAFRHVVEFEDTSLRFAAWRQADAHFWRCAVLFGAVGGAAVCLAAKVAGQRLLFPGPWPTLILQLTLGPVLEEMVFRGYFFHLSARLVGSIQTGAGGWLTVGTSAVVFALFHLLRTHLSWAELLAIALTGIAYGYIRLRSGSVAPAALAHAVYNACVLARTALFSDL